MSDLIAPALRYGNAYSSALVDAPDSWKDGRAHLHTAVQSPWYHHLACLLDEVCYATHQFYRTQGIRSVLLPITCESVSSPMGRGSDSLPVRASIQGRDSYLADSMQFMLEFATRLELGAGVYYIMPSFRGEQTDARHLFQFFHSEVEITGGLEDIFALAEDYVLALATHVLAHARQHVAALAGSVAHLEQLVARGRPFPRIRMEDAPQMLADVPNAWHTTHLGDRVLGNAGERALVERFGDFVWATHAPAMAVPFYQATEAGTDCALTGDLLAGIGEVLGAGARCATGNDLETALRRHEVDPSEYEWYREMKTQYPAQTAGFGMGIERFILWLTRTTDIRNCTLLLREIDRAHTP